MKIYIAHSSGFDFKQELYLPLRKSNINNIHTIILPHEISKEQYPTKHELPSIDLVVAEVSFPSTGMGIELGWADMLGKKVILLRKTESKVSAALGVLNIFANIEYSSAQDMITKLEAEIAKL